MLQITQMTLLRCMAAGIAPVLTLGTVGAWTPGTYPAPSRDLAVDRSERNDVLAFWHGVYQASEGFQDRMAWTGNYSTDPGAEGSNSAAFIADMERRLNYFRAMTGVPATARMNSSSTVVIAAGDAHIPPSDTLKSAAAQRAALMITMSYNPATPQVIPPEYSHTPPVSDIWTEVTWNAANKGNIALNVNGPDAISAYVLENFSGSQSGENSAAGHRRWLLKAASTDFATGDVPLFFDPSDPSTRRAAANVTYVVPKTAELAAVAPTFVSYPPSGFFPAPLNARFWSLTYPGANFAAATVSVTHIGGSLVPVTVMSRNFPAGDSTITWQVPSEHAAKSFPDDRTYSVTVSGISGAGIPTSHNYQVTLVNPNRLTSDQSLSGTSVPHPPTPAKYTFTAPSFAESLRVNTYRQIPVAWTENAELGNPSFIIDRTIGGYGLLSEISFQATPEIEPIAGERSFRLTHNTALTPPDQIFELGRGILPRQAAALKFQYRRGFMTSASKLFTEASTDGGVTWAQIGDAISGTGTNMVDPAVTDLSISLPTSENPVYIRFRFVATPGSIFADNAFPTFPTGIFIDSITTENADWLEPRKTNELAADTGTFTLDLTTQGGPMLVGEQWHLALQTKLGDRWFPDGPLKAIQPSATPPLTPYQVWLAENPGLIGAFDEDDDGDGIPNGVEYAFYGNPLGGPIPVTEVLASPGGSDVSVRVMLASPREGVTYSAECSETLTDDWSSENVTVTLSDGFITATAPRPPSGRCFLRWKIIAE